MNAVANGEGRTEGVEPDLGEYEVLRPDLRVFVSQFAQDIHPLELREAVESAQEPFLTFAQETGGELEQRKVWDGSQEVVSDKFVARAFPHSVTVDLPRIRADGRTTYFIPREVGNFSPDKARVVHVQPDLGEGNNFEEVWVVASHLGKPFKPWRVRARGDSSLSQDGIGGIAQGWFSPGMRWRNDRVYRSEPLGTWFVLVGRPAEHIHDAPPAETVLVGGHRFIVDTRTASFRGSESPQNGLPGRTEVEVYRCCCFVSWEGDWYKATTSSRRVFAGTTAELRSRDEFQCLGSAALAVEEKCRWCIHHGCYRPHFAAANPKINFNGYPGCDGMPSRAL